MKIYSSYGFNDFVVCLGYKGYSIKDYFEHYFLHESDITFDFTNNNERVIHHHTAEPWRVTLVNTGLDTMTGGRIKRIREYLNDDTFMLTYGDGVAPAAIGPSQTTQDIGYCHDNTAEWKVWCTEFRLR